MLKGLLTTLLAGEADRAIGRAKRAAVAYAVAAILGAIGLFFLLIAIFIYLTLWFGPLIASLGLALIFLLAALLVVIIQLVSARSLKRQQKRERRADLAAIGTTATLAALPGLLRGGKHPWLGPVLLPAIGLAAFLLFRKRGSADGDES